MRQIGLSEHVDVFNMKNPDEKSLFEKNRHIHVNTVRLRLFRSVCTLSSFQASFLFRYLDASPAASDDRYEEDASRRVPGSVQRRRGFLATRYFPIHSQALFTTFASVAPPFAPQLFRDSFFVWLFFRLLSPPLRPLEMRLIDLEADPSSLFQFDVSKPAKQLDVVFDYSTGQIVGFEEIDTEKGQTATNSTSLLREPGSASDFIRGNSEAAPFLPGGYDREPSQGKAAGKSKQPAGGFDERDPIIAGLEFGISWDQSGAAQIVSEKDISLLATKGTSTSNPHRLQFAFSRSPFAA